MAEPLPADSPFPAPEAPLTCLVTGATGYIGGRLVPELLEAGHRVRVLTRSPERLRDHPWAGQVESRVVTPRTPTRSPRPAPERTSSTTWSTPSAPVRSSRRPTGGPPRSWRGRRGTRVSAGSSTWAGSSPGGEELSPHLRSRTEVAEILLGSGVPTVVLRAAVIIGSGSASFEMLRYLTERLPVMVTPRWVHSRIQPIAVRDVLRYLVGCARLPADGHRGFDIGGPDVLTYAEMMQRYAVVAGLPRRRILPVPLLTPSLSSHWVGLVTPVPAGDRPAAGRIAAQQRRLRGARHRRVRARPAGGPARLRRRRAPGPARIQRRRRRDPLVGRLGARRPVRPAAHRSGLGRRQPLHRRAVPHDDGATRGRCGRSSRASAASRLVLLPAGLGGARLAGPAGRRRRPAPRPARPRTASTSATRWTSGGSRSATRDACCGCGRRCGCPGWPGSSSTWNTTGPPVTRCCVSAPPSTRRGLAGHLYWWRGRRLPRDRLRRDGPQHHPRRRAAHRLTDERGRASQ